MFHKPIRTTFKFNPIHGMSGRVGSALDPSTYGDSLDKVLDYFYGLLESYSFCLVRNQNFSLINVSSIKQQSSVGYSEVDLGEMPSEIVLAFTFSLVPRPSQKLKRESTYIPLMNFDFIWGKTGRDSQYLTITLTNQQCKQFGIDYNNIKHMIYLYNNIGLCTKSFVLHPRGWYTSTVYQPLNHPFLRDKYLTKNLNSLLKEEPAGYWIYNKYFWQECSQLVVSRFLTPDFYKYFAVHILRSIPPKPYGYSYSWLFKSTPKSFLRFIEEGVLRFVSLINVKSDPNKIGQELRSNPDLYSVAFLVYAMVEDIADTEEYDDLVEFISVLGNMDSLKKSSVLRLFSRVKGAALDLISDDSQFADMLVEVMQHE